MNAQLHRVPAMELTQLLRDVVSAPLPAALPVRGLALDSRAVHPGYLFLACHGHDHHGLQHLADARARGAVAVAYDPEGASAYREVLAGMPAFAIPQLAQCAGHLAARFYGDPSRHQQVVAVTGTNGKTSVSLITAQALTELGHRCGVLGTLGYGLYGALEAPTHTTPDAVTVQQKLAHFRDAGATHVSMEASSHALDQGRVNGVHVAVGIFTNLTRDHLDYHGSMENYGAAKRRLFDMPGLKHAVINLDDAFGRELARGMPPAVECIGYSLEGARSARGRTLAAANLVLHSGGTEMEVWGDFGSGHIDSRLLGRFNAQNLLAVNGALLALGVPLAEALVMVSRARTVPGRMECFGGGLRAPLVVVDYAHTPDALEKALSAARSHCRGQLFCVFGCGGERDRGKRPQMGAIAARLADRVIVTDDNPRHEDGGAIIREILAGIPDAGPVRVERDRAQAVAEALHAAAPGDVVLVAGKGHEDYQIIGDESRAYSDRDTVSDLLGEVRR